MKWCFFVPTSFFCLLFSTGCTSFLINSTKPVMVEMIVKPAFDVFMQEPDVQLATSAIGGQIKLAEVLMQKIPDEPELLMLLCRGYASYGQLLEPECNAMQAKGDAKSDAAAKKMTTRIRNFALRGRKHCFQILDTRYKGFSTAAFGDLAEFAKFLKNTSKQDADALFWLGYAWGYAILNGLTDPEMVAQIPHLKMLMERVIVLQPDYFYGAAHLFLGTLYAQSPMFGGDLKKSKAHFDEAMKYSKGKMLLVHYFKARYLANQSNDSKLCASLIKQILDAPDTLAPHLMLINQLAKLQAAQAQTKIDEFCP